MCIFLGCETFFSSLTVLYSLCYLVRWCKQQFTAVKNLSSRTYLERTTNLLRIRSFSNAVSYTSFNKGSAKCESSCNRCLKVSSKCNKSLWSRKMLILRNRPGCLKLPEKQRIWRSGRNNIPLVNRTTCQCFAKQEETSMSKRLALVFERNVRQNDI